MARTTPNLGLRIWTDVNDPYDHDQLANNFTKIDFHDHSPGRGSPIPSEGLANGAVTTAKLATGAGVNDSATLRAVGSFSAYRAAAYAAVASGTQLVFDTEGWDIGGWYETSGLWTPAIPGFYRVNAVATVSTDLTANQFVELGFTVDGTIVRNTPRWIQPAASPTTGDMRIGGTAIIQSNGTNVIGVKVTSSAAVTFVVGQADMYFQGELIGRT